MPTITNFGDVVTQGNTTATGNLTVQGIGTCSFTSATSAVTMAGTLAVTGVTTHSSNIIPSADFGCGIGTAGTRFGNIYSANTNIYTTANIFVANIVTLNVTNIATFQNSVYHVQNTFSTGYIQTTGVIIPTTTGASGLGGPSLLFANAFLQTANIGSSTAQLSLNVVGNVFISNSINVTNVLAATMNATYMNVITGGYANMASINVFTGANATFLTVQTLANVYGTANIVTSNTQTANIVFANVQTMNVSTGANTTYLSVQTLANVYGTANIVTSNTQSANIVTSNIQNLNVYLSTNTTALTVTGIANIFSANILTTNTQSANIVTSNIQNLNVYLSTNTTALTVTGIANIFSANILTTNTQSANIVTSNIQNLNVSTGANATYLSVQTLANIYGTANIVTSNTQSANIVTSNIQNLNVSTGANTTYLSVQTLANVYGTANIITTNVQFANIVTSNIQNLNVYLSTNTAALTVTGIANIFSANVLTANVQTANVVTANVQNLNVSTGANITTLFVQTFANILSSNIVSAFHSTVNVSSTANVFTANINSGNVQSTWNVSGLLSATLHSGNASALSNINASNVTMGILPFRNDGAIGLGATAISVNGSVGVANQYLSSTGTSLQWVGPPAAIFSQVPTSTNQIFYNSGNVAIGVYNWTQFGAGYNTYPGVPLDVYGGAGSFSNVSDANQTGTIRIMQNAASWGANGGLEFKTGANIAGAGHRIVTTELVSSSGIAPLIFQYRANTPVWSNAMVIHNGSTTPGFVGIGTMAPLFNLHVYQVSNTSPATLTVQMSNTQQSSQLYLSNASGTTTQLYLNGPNSSADGPVNSATLRNNAGDLRLAAASTNPYIYLQNSSSNVGINTTTATQALDVAGYARIGSSTSDISRLILGRAPGATNFDYASMIESVSNFASYYGSILKFYTHGAGTTGADPTLAMTINQTQQVGIGVAPAYKFHVDNGANSGIACVHQASSIVAGNTTSMILGKALSTNNSATFLWNHVGEGLATNYMGIGYYGGDNKLCVTASGNIGIGTTNPGSALSFGQTIANKIITLWDGNSADAVATATNFYGFGINGSVLRYQVPSSTSHVWYESGTERMRILAGGNVGIGTASPGFTLDVYGGVRCSVNGSVSSAEGTNNAITAYAPGGTTGNASIWMGFDPTNDCGYINSARSGSIRPVAIQTRGGGVGIGTTNPSDVLHVYGTSNPSIRIDAGSGGTTDPRLQFYSGAALRGRIAYSYGGSYMYYQNDTQDVMRHYNGAGGSIILQPVSGSVGIGMAPSYPLDVTGKIRGSREIISSSITDYGQFRAIGGNYGSFIRNDGSTTYWLVTASGDQYGSWSAVRPFYFANGTGYVTMENGATISGGVTINGGATVNGGYTGYGNQNYFGGYAGTGGNGFDFEDQGSFMRMAQRNVRWYDWGGAGDFFYAHNGCVGIRTDQTSSVFEVAGRSYFWGTSPSGGGQNRFTGLLGDSIDGSRAQVVLNSAYSDMVISSSQANGTHGSTVSFVANSTANNDYRKFVINVGGWGGYGSGGYGDRMSFGWKDAAYTNPHSYVQPNDSTMMLDGRNKRVGINNVDTPGYNLHVNGTAYVSTECYCGSWFRTYGNGGHYWESWGGGWYMEDSTYLRSYVGKTIYTAGQIAAAGDIIAYFSDMRLKKNIEPITNAIDKIKTLSTFTYEANEVGASYGLEEHVRNTGFSAQEVQQVMPEVIRLAPFDMGDKNEVTGVIESKSGENYMTLLYDKMAPLIVAALKEEVQKREDLEKEVAELKQLVQNLLARQ